MEKDETVHILIEGVIGHESPLGWLQRPGVINFLWIFRQCGVSPWKRLTEFTELQKSEKKFAVVFVTASDAMDFFFFFGGGCYRLCRVPEIKSYILS